MRAPQIPATTHGGHYPRRRTAGDAEAAVLLPAAAVTRPDPARLRDLGPRGLLTLQCSAGNQATSGLLRGSPGRHLPVQRDGDAPTVGSPQRRGIRSLPAHLWLAEPGGFLSDKPTLVPPGGLRPIPASGVEGLIDWGVMGTAYQDRQLVLEDRDRSLIVGHWQRWYPVAQGLYKLPLAKSLFDSPAAIMNTMSAKMIDSSLAGDRPNMAEMFDRRAEQFGVRTTTVSVTVGHF